MDENIFYWLAVIMNSVVPTDKWQGKIDSVSSEIMACKYPWKH